jgi:hypothetical protein
MGTKETRKRCPAVGTTGRRSLAWKVKVLAKVGRLFLGWLVLVRGSGAARFISCARVRSLQQRMTAGSCVGKHALGDASHSGLCHYTMKCGTNELEIDLYTSPELRGCNLVGTEEERRFLVGTFRRISISEAKFALSNETMDDLTKDVEVSAVKAIMLAVLRGFTMVMLRRSCDKSC